MANRHWLATYGSIPSDINPDAHASILALMEGAMTRYADKVAIVSAGQKLTYRQMDELSVAFCAYLQGLGVKKGDRVAVMLPNVAAFPVALAGIVRAGAIQVNVNPLYTPRELEHQLNDAGCERIRSGKAARLEMAEQRLPGVRRVAKLESVDGFGSQPPLCKVIPGRQGAARFAT